MVVLIINLKYDNLIQVFIFSMFFSKRVGMGLVKSLIIILLRDQIKYLCVWKRLISDGLLFYIGFCGNGSY